MSTSQFAFARTIRSIVRPTGIGGTTTWANALSLLSVTRALGAVPEPSEVVEGLSLTVLAERMHEARNLLLNAQLSTPRVVAEALRKVSATSGTAYKALRDILPVRYLGEPEVFHVVCETDRQSESIWASFQSFQSHAGGRAPLAASLPLILGCLGPQLWRDALSTVRYFRSHGVYVAPASYATTARLAATSGAWEVVLRLHAQTLQHVVPLSCDPVLRNALLVALYFKGGDDGAARAVLHSMEKDSIPLDPQAPADITQALRAAGSWRECLLLLQSGENFCGNEDVVCTVFEVCRTARRDKDVTAVVEFLNEKGVKWTPRLIATALRVALYCQRVADAYDIYFDHVRKVISKGVSAAQPAEPPFEPTTFGYCLAATALMKQSAMSLSITKYIAGLKQCDTVFLEKLCDAFAKYVQPAWMASVQALEVAFHESGLQIPAASRASFLARSAKFSQRCYHHTNIMDRFIGKD